MLEPIRRFSIVDLPERAPRLLWWLPALLLGIGLGLSPEVLIALGPLRKSLTSDNAMTRDTAEATVLAARIAGATLGVVLAASILAWQRWRNHAWVVGVARHHVPELRQRAHSRLRGTALISVSLAWLLGVAYVAAFARLLPSWAARLIDDEDGLFEYGTALMFLVASLLAVTTALRLLRHGRSSLAQRAAVWHALLAAFFFLCCGEEISWGQRIFGFQTVEAMEGLNVQNENNLHNMMGYLADHLFILGVLVYGGLLPLLARYTKYVRKALDWLGIPLASTGLAIGFVLVSLLHDWTVYAAVPHSGVRVAELREFLSAMCFLLLMVQSVQMVSEAKQAMDAGRVSLLDGLRPAV